MMIIVGLLIPFQKLESILLLLTRHWKSAACLTDFTILELSINVIRKHLHRCRSPNSSPLEFRKKTLTVFLLFFSSLYCIHTVHISLTFSTSAFWPFTFHKQFTLSLVMSRLLHFISEPFQYSNALTFPNPDLAPIHFSPPFNLTKAIISKHLDTHFFDSATVVFFSNPQDDGRLSGNLKMRLRAEQSQNILILTHFSKFQYIVRIVLSIKWSFCCREANPSLQFDVEQLLSGNFRFHQLFPQILPDWNLIALFTLWNLIELLRWSNLQSLHLWSGSLSNLEATCFYFSKQLAFPWLRRRPVPGSQIRLNDWLFPGSPTNLSKVTSLVGRTGF